MAASTTIPTASSSVPATAMTPTERRSSLALALIFALRMLGLFLVLPVFELEARKYPGGDNPALIGLAMGMYGLTQAFLQFPYGMASDRLGRKKVIIAGLVVFAAGSFYAMTATSLIGLLVGRALQGAGAVSAAVTALLADQTRDVVRTKAMALVGASIGLMFALALVLAPPLVAHIGLGGLFGFTGVLAVIGIAVVAWVVPAEPAKHADAEIGRIADVLHHPQLLRMYLGVFCLHAVQLAMWMVVPTMLVASGLDKSLHWHVYLPAVLLSFFIMGGLLFPLERRGHLKAVLLVAIALVGGVQIALLSLAGHVPSVWVMGILMLVFFCGFNTLEASMPSLTSRLAPSHSRGSAMGAYNTCQSLGLFAGSALGGTLLKVAGPQTMFAVAAGLCLVWLLVFLGLAPTTRP